MFPHRPPTSRSTDLQPRSPRSLAVHNQSRHEHDRERVCASDLYLIFVKKKHTRECIHLGLFFFFKDVFTKSLATLCSSRAVFVTLTKRLRYSNMTTESNKGPPSAITLAFSVITHFLLLAPVLYILVLAFGKYSFFAWHPICMSVGVGLLITEAVFSISGEAYIASKLARRNRVTIHWVLHTIGLALIGIGFVIIIVNKVNMNKSHFATPHSQLGLVTIVLSVLTAAFGILAKNTVWVYPRVRPILIKVAHACGGIGITILLLATLITGTYTTWWPGTTTGRDLIFASLFFAGLLILIKPVLGAISRCRVVFGPPSSDS